MSRHDSTESQDALGIFTLGIVVQPFYFGYQKMKLCKRVDRGLKLWHGENFNHHIFSFTVIIYSAYSKLHSDHPLFPLLIIQISA